MSNNETRGGVFSTAVIPAAGLGTRFLPVTKTVPNSLRKRLPMLVLIVLSSLHLTAKRV